MLVSNYSSNHFRMKINAAILTNKQTSKRGDNLNNSEPNYNSTKW